MANANESSTNPNPGNAGLTGSSVSNPAPVGFTLRTTIERGDAYLFPETYNVDITLLEVLRGREALDKIENSETLPGAGCEYVLVRLKFGYSRRGRRADSEAYTLTEGLFAAFSADGKQEYELPSNSLPLETALVGRAFQPGETQVGNILFQVPETEKRPLLAFKRKHVEGIYGIFGFVWFQLYSG